MPGDGFRLGYQAGTTLAEGLAQYRELRNQRQEREEFQRELTIDDQRRLAVETATTPTTREAYEQAKALIRKYPNAQKIERPVPGGIQEDGSPEIEEVIQTPEGDIPVAALQQFDTNEREAFFKRQKLETDRILNFQARLPNNRYAKEYTQAQMGRLTQERQLFIDKFKAQQQELELFKAQTELQRAQLERERFESEPERKREEAKFATNERVRGDVEIAKARAGLDAGLEREKSGLRVQEKAAEAQLQAPSKARERASDLRKEFQSRPETKEFAVARNGFEQIQNLAEDDSGTSDYALIVTSLKILDPAGSVREGEVQSVQLAPGELSRFQSYLNRFTDEGRLPEQARQELVQVARSGYEARVRNQLDLEKNYADQATRDGTDIEGVILGGSLVPDEHLKALGIDRTAAPARARETKPTTIIVTNGSETIRIPEADLAEAEAEGFRRVR